jgi:hypothetical protein
MKTKAIAVVVGVLAVMLVASVATATFPTDSVGQGSSDIWVMNLESSEANVVAAYYNRTGGTPDASVGGTIDPWGNASFPAASSGLGDDWLGSMVLYADKELASAAELYWQNVPRGDGWSGAGYLGYSEGSNEFYLPGVAKTPYHRSIVTVQCVDTVDCPIWITYRGVDGGLVGDSPYTEVIEADSQETHDLHDPSLNPNIPDIPDDQSWFGTVQVTSTQQIAGVVVTHWMQGYAAGNNGLVPGTDTTVYFTSLNKRNFGGEWKGQSDWSGFSIQNINAVPIVVYASVYGSAGGPAIVTFSDTIPALSSHNYNLRTGSDIPASTFDPLGTVFLGTATVTSENAIVGAASGVRFPSGGLAGGYLGVTHGANKLVIPAAFRAKSGSKWLAYSALAVQNVDPNDDCDVTLTYYNSDGTQGVQFGDTIPANAVHAYSTRAGGNTPDGAATFNPLGDSWSGTVVVTTDDPGDSVTGVMTNQIEGSNYIYMWTYNAVMLEQ